MLKAVAASHNKALTIVVTFILSLILILSATLIPPTMAKKSTSSSSKQEKSTTRSSAEEAEYMRQQADKLNKFVKWDEGQRVEPYLGGFNSQRAQMLQVDFHAFEAIQGGINSRWRAVREMVEDMQKMLLTGGVKTNIFQNNKYKNSTQQPADSFIFVLNDADQLRQAVEFLEQLAEVKDVIILSDSNPNGQVLYSNDEL